MTNVQWVQSRLAEAFPHAIHRAVHDPKGDDQHLQVVLVHPCFLGISLVQCHQQVYDVLDNLRGGAIHAISLEVRA